MFNKHLFSVILGFCGMILLGLISLTIIDSLNRDQVAQTAMQKAGQKPVPNSTPNDVILPPIKAHTSTSVTIKK